MNGGVIPLYRPWPSTNYQPCRESMQSVLHGGFGTVGNDIGININLPLHAYQKPSNHPRILMVMEMKTVLSSHVDVPRLQRTFSSEALSWILERLRRRLEQGRPLRGLLTLQNATGAQRDAVDRLLG